MEKMRSSIFLADLSVVDHAFIDNKGRIIGGSYNPGFIVSGEVSDDESVVVDFSTIKKDLKTHIDKHVHNVDLNGFDHKLWLIEGYSNCEIDELSDIIRITTPAFIGSFPNDAVRWIQNPYNDVFNDDFIGTQFANHLTQNLTKIYPNINLKIQCINTTNVHVIDSQLPLYYFRYSHGLKDSTSYGCQNLGHGHLSYLQYKDDDLCFKIAEDLHEAVFINADNIVYEDKEELGIEYTTERGFFSGVYNKNLNKLIILDTETTIEYIAVYVAETYGITDFYISEGLSKGTYYG